MLVGQVIVITDITELKKFKRSYMRSSGNWQSLPKELMVKDLMII